jgi:Rieske Fe-S protein
MSESDRATKDRRRFLGRATAVAMGGGLLASYGTFFAYAGRYLYPAGPAPTAWLYVARVDDLKVGDSILYRTPLGERVVVTRTAAEGAAGDFLALSSTCPHLGCQVHWESAKNRFFCPCHNGVFDPSGLGIDGPPKGQSLVRFPLRVEGGLLFIEVAARGISVAAGLRKPGHDGCLGAL